LLCFCLLIVLGAFRPPGSAPPAQETKTRAFRPGPTALELQFADELFSHLVSGLPAWQSLLAFQVAAHADRQASHRKMGQKAFAGVRAGAGTLHAKGRLWQKQPDWLRWF
jgi:hypothetical protein